jgi:TRAP-type C4-dicarboxylate transport system permease large subunit
MAIPFFTRGPSDEQTGLTDRSSISAAFWWIGSGRLGLRQRVGGIILAGVKGSAPRMPPHWAPSSIRPLKGGISPGVRRRAYCGKLAYRPIIPPSIFMIIYAP